jgi:uncharacterized protein (TIGR03437 family)
MRLTKTTTLRLLALALPALTAFSGACHAQSYDSSGDGMLNGTYYTRQVIYVVQGQQSPQGTVGQAVNTYGNVTFDGNGNYTFSGWFLDSSSGSSTPVQFTSSGTYAISASGMGYLTEMNTQEGFASTDFIVGMVSHGIFIGSTTDNTEGFNDLMIAAPVGSGATNATFSGAYTLAYMDASFPADALLTLNSQGNGTVGTVNVNSFLATNSTATTQTISGVTYAFTNGAAQLNFGGDPTKVLIAGTELLYISPDGNFVFGGSANGFDMFVGVRNATTNPSNYDALYYQAGLDMDELPINNGYVLLDSYYGAINVFSGNIIGHQSVNSQLIYNGASDYSYYDSYTLNGDGSSDDVDFAQHYLSSSDGTIRIGYGATAGFLSLNVALQAPTFTGSGVYLNPTGMVNAASSSPFSAHLSPGEFLTLYGSNLAPSAASAPSLPLQGTLNGVQVMINGRQAPLLFVSSGQINLIVPFFTESIAQIQVINNGASSNTVTQFVGTTSAGVFTSPAGGIGEAAALHTADFSLVSDSSPAQAGETVAVYLAGLGPVSPANSDGAAGPGGTPSNAVNTPQVYLSDSQSNYLQATVGFAGLAPGFAGLYQINFTVPSGLASGLASLEILGPDSDTFESLIPVGTPTSAVAPAARAKAAGQPHLLEHHRLQR